MQSLTYLLWNGLRFTNLGFLLLLFHPQSILIQEGWHRSFRSGRAVNRVGDPLPWYTYAFIHFIESKLQSHWRVFEYGSGNSTLWYAQRVRDVIAVENDVRWMRRIALKLPANTKIVHQELQSNYIEEIKQHGSFNIIVIDGSWRLECAKHALHALVSDGVIIWDNSDRWDFAEGAAYLRQFGFRHIAFYGLLSNHYVAGETSILYRSENCLGI